MTGQSSSAPPFRLLRRTRRRGQDSTLHAHAESQLIFAASGTTQVYTEAGRWLVPPQLAVWAPAGVKHKVVMLSDTDLWFIYWRPQACRSWAPARSLNRTFALRVTPLLRELIFAAFAAEDVSDKAELVVRLILHELIETPDAPTFLPLPASVVGRRVANVVIADTRMLLGIEDVASRAATSKRSISRLFPLETGLTFKAWRQRARIVLAIERLSAGCPIAKIASDTGFASTAAFSFAFRQVTMMTPTAFLQSEPYRGPVRNGASTSIGAGRVL